jgi:hypothetical protein
MNVKSAVIFEQAQSKLRLSLPADPIARVRKCRKAMRIDDRNGGSSSGFFRDVIIGLIAAAVMLLVAIRLKPGRKGSECAEQSRCLKSVQSPRSASTGSTDAARRAGK